MTPCDFKLGEGSDYSAFLEFLGGVLEVVPCRDHKILLKDLNAYVGNDRET